MERERFGRGGSGGGGINRYPDVSGRSQPNAAPRQDRSYSRGGDRPGPAAGPAPRSSNEPWSDVPPELEAMLRAQVAQKPPTPRPATASSRTSEAPEATEPVAKSAAKPRATRKPRAAAEAGDRSTAEKPAPKLRATRTPKASGSSSAVTAAPSTAADSATGGTAAKAAAKPRAARKPAAKADAAEAPGAADAADAANGTAAAPKRRTTRKTAPAEPA
jgi:hypothetical protein